MYRKKIDHLENCLPELDIQDDLSKFSWFCKRVGSISIDSTFNFAFESIYTREDLIIGKPIYFTPEVEDEVIRDAVSQIKQTSSLSIK